MSNCRMLMTRTTTMILGRKLVEQLCTNLPSRTARGLGVVSCATWISQTKLQLRGTCSPNIKPRWMIKTQKVRLTSPKRKMSPTTLKWTLMTRMQDQKQSMLGSGEDQETEEQSTSGGQFWNLAHR